jgi:hypothetical protein
MKLSLAFSAVALVAAQTQLVRDYCGLLEQKCFFALQLNVTACVAGMTAIPDGTLLDGDNNTIGCRLNYLNSTTTATNCRYAAPSGGGRCGSILEATCTVATTLCGNDTMAPYNTTTACTAGLTPFAHLWGSQQGLASGADNSLECRMYHALVSASGAVNAAQHCQHYGANSPTCTAPIVPDKQHYCDVLQYNCQSSTTLQYADAAQCLNVAQNFITNLNGTDAVNDTNTKNSLGCREYHAQASKANAAVHCQHAGPSGGNVCGTFAQSWGIMAAAKPCNDTGVQSLIAQVGETLLNKLIPVGPSAPYSKFLDNVNNSQTCRIYHLGVATIDSSHCSHGSVEGGQSCGDYVPNLCDFIEGACGFGSNAWQYANSSACVSGIKAVITNTNSLGNKTDFATNSLACRFYHAGVAATFAPGMSKANPTNLQLHCGHVLAPSTPGGCGAAASPTGAPTTMKTNGASAFSVAVSAVVVSASLLSL